MIRVLLADDHPLFLDGLRLLLDSTPGLEVVGAAADGAGLLELAENIPYDVAVVDLDMPGVDGAAATRQLLQRDPAARVLVLTMHDDDASVQRALRAGARGYLLKGAPRGAIARAVEALAEGDTVLGGDIGARVLRAATAEAAGPATGRTGGRLPQLTARELEVLDLVARGLANHQIAARLFLSVKTVQNRVSDLLTKVGAASRAELVARARDAGLGGPTP